MIILSSTVYAEKAKHTLVRRPEVPRHMSWGLGGGHAGSAMVRLSPSSSWHSSKRSTAGAGEAGMRPSSFHSQRDMSKCLYSLKSQKLWTSLSSWILSAISGEHSQPEWWPGRRGRCRSALLFRHMKESKRSLRRGISRRSARACCTCLRCFPTKSRPMT